MTSARKVAGRNAGVSGVWCKFWLATRTQTMNFGQAIEALKASKMVRREGWNGKGMHLYLEEGRHLPLSYGIEKGTTRTYDPVICMYTAQKSHQPGWLASQADMLADDWQEVPREEA